ncbi:MAG TPA: phosphoribosylformylglycinamidine synthase subunit PurQ [Bacteroidota bacterium]|nr:phosphoribosylformylglycinamidine synthase subunit PurQ [Bacteroidota bacterium]
MSKTKFGVVVFPGSNCDHDAFAAASRVMEQEARYIWHKEGSLGDVDVVILPGGFSYGDYLRTGAIARFSPVMKEVVRFAKKGGTVIGICNGFQILLEAGLLPGAMLRNGNLKFVCRHVFLRVENAETRFTSECSAGDVLKIPVAHGEGNYIADEATVESLKERDQILFRYCSSSGVVDAESNPNGSMENIAGIMNSEGNVMGMMPHPERAMESELGSADGRKVFQSVIGSLVLT